MSGTLVAVGDSIAGGFTASVNWPTLVGSALGMTVHNPFRNAYGWRFNASGGTSDSIITHAASDVDIYVNVSPQPFLILAAGVNDIFWGDTGTQAYASFLTYYNARLAAGWAPSHIIAVTITPAAQRTPQNRALYNNALINGALLHGYSLARIDLDPFLGPDGANLNTTYYNADATHPNDFGQNKYALVIEHSLAFEIDLIWGPSQSFTYFLDWKAPFNQGLSFTGTDDIQLPIDCAIMGNQTEYKTFRTAEIPHQKSVKTKGSFQRSGLRKLG